MDERLTKSIEILKGGGVILVPGDVSWGLACDATNPAPLNKIRGQAGIEWPPVMLMENPALLDRYVEDVPDVGWDLMEISVTPLTIVFHGVRSLAAELISAENGAPFRLIKEGFVVRLLQRFRKPLAFFAIQSRLNFVTDLHEIPSAIINTADFIAEGSSADIFSTDKPSVIRLWSGGRMEIEKPR